MRILIATGIYPPEIGGPAIYAKEIHDELVSRGIVAPVFHFGRLERALPAGLRHLAYALRIFPHMRTADAVLAFDTGSAGLPALLIARLFGKRFLVRIGGDFLWESYVERTGDKVRLSQFYGSHSALSLKERIVFRGIRYILSHSYAILFTTKWQKDIWKHAYGFAENKAHILENYYPPRERGEEPDKKSFLFIGRVIKLKNEDLFQSAFDKVKRTYPDIVLDGKGMHFTREGYFERVRRSYAVVLPSVSDVNPNMIIDAVKYGKPFLCTKDTGIYDRLKDAGVFIDTLSEDEIVRGLEELLDPRRYKELCGKVQAFSYTHSWEEITNEILTVMRKP